jgi:transglutaminase/protease-like cytokinesis protein 3
MKNYFKFQKQFIIATSIVISSNTMAFDLGLFNNFTKDNALISMDAGKEVLGNLFDRAKNALQKEKERQDQLRKEEAEKQKILDEQAAVQQANYSLREKNLNKVSKDNNNFNVNNSHVQLNQQFTNSVRWIMVKIELAEKSESIVYRVDNGSINTKLYLRFGKGEYKIRIYTNTNADGYGVSYDYFSDFNVSNSDERDLAYLLPSNEVQSEDPAILEIAQTISANANTELEKVKMIHDFVANLIAYDDEGYITKSYLTTPTDALFVLKRKITVCAGYSTLFAAISRASGIRTAIVHGKIDREDGTREEHAWNSVFINNEWKVIDVTWDDVTNLRYDYFLPDAATFSKDHSESKFQSNL